MVSFPIECMHMKCIRNNILIYIFCKCICYATTHTHTHIYILYIYHRSETIPNSICFKIMMITIKWWHFLTERKRERERMYDRGQTRGPNSELIGRTINEGFHYRLQFWTYSLLAFTIYIYENKTCVKYLFFWRHLFGSFIICHFWPFKLK